MPKGPPVIANIDQVFFKLGDWLNLNCTSKPSRPPTRLTWLVNGVEVIYHTLPFSLEKTPKSLVVEGWGWCSMIHQNPLLNSFPWKTFNVKSTQSFEILGLFWQYTFLVHLHFGVSSGYWVAKALLLNLVLCHFEGLGQDDPTIYHKPTNRGYEANGGHR